MNNDYISQKVKLLKEAGKKKLMQAGGIYDQPQPYSPYQNPLFANYLTPQEAANMQFRPESTLQPFMEPDISAPTRMPLQSLQAQGFVPQGLAPLQPAEITTAGAMETYPQANIQYNENVQNKLYNPYSGINLETALFTLGQSLGYEGENRTANTIRGAASAGKIAIGGARTLLSGMGYQNRNDYTQNQFMQQLYNPEFSYSYLQEGGQVTNADVMTGAYLVQTPVGQPNAEIETGEVLKDGATGNIQVAVGDTHENGGIKVELSNGTKVLSDFTKIGAQKAKLFRKEFDIKNIKATDTFASVMEKYNKDLGWNKLIDEEADTIEEIANQEQSDIEATTKDLNLNHLSTKLQGIDVNKELLKPSQDEAFEKIFAEQEKLPKKQQEKMQEGGQFDENIIALSQQYNIAPERVMELLQKSGQAQDAQTQVTQALQQGVSPEQIISSLVQSGVPQDQAEQLVANGTNSQPVMQQGGVFYTPSPYALPTYENQPFGSVDYLAGNITDPNVASQRILSQSDVLPYTLRASGLLTDDNQAAIQAAENVTMFQTKYNEYLNAASAAIEANPNLTEAQKQELKTRTASEGFTPEVGNIKSVDAIYGNYTGSRGSFNLPLITQEEKAKFPQIKRIGDVLDDKGEIKSEYTDLSPETKDLIKKSVGKSGTAAFDIGILPIPTEETVTPTTVDGQPVVIDTNRVNYSMPRIPQDFLLPPTAASPVFKASVSLSQVDPTKISAEPNLIEIDRQSQAAAQALAYLPDSQRVAAMSSILGQSQLAANQAVTNAEITNAQNRAQAQLYNAQVSDKQQLLDNQFAQDYEQKVFAGQLASERDLRQYLNDLNLQQRYNFGYIDRRNAFNEAPLRYKITGDGITFQDNGNIVSMPSTTFPTLTAAEQKAIIAKRAAEEAKKAAKKK